MMSAKQLAAELRVGRSYVYALRRAMALDGCPWPRGLVTLEIVITWLRAHPGFKSKPYPICNTSVECYSRAGRRQLARGITACFIAGA